MASRLFKSKSPAFEPLHLKTPGTSSVSGLKTTTRLSAVPSLTGMLSRLPGGDRWEAVAGSALPVHREGSLARWELSVSCVEVEGGQMRSKFVRAAMNGNYVGSPGGQGFGCHVNRFPPRRSCPLLHHTVQEPQGPSHRPNHQTTTIHGAKHQLLLHTFDTNSSKLSYNKQPGYEAVISNKNDHGSALAYTKQQSYDSAPPTFQTSHFLILSDSINVEAVFSGRLNDRRTRPTVPYNCAPPASQTKIHPYQLSMLSQLSQTPQRTAAARYQRI
ncbi:hypothetical protein B0H19DRAFT_1064139 [Mycena capillaripes]|nr:hypothetical protein B0H19DRAFT_1064139 [Mycena capillaripes]